MLFIGYSVIIVFMIGLLVVNFDCFLVIYFLYKYIIWMIEKNIILLVIILWMIFFFVGLLIVSNFLIVVYIFYLYISFIIVLVFFMYSVIYREVRK